MDYLLYLFKIRKHAIPVPLVGACVELRAGCLCPCIVVETGPAVKEHAIHGAAPANDLASEHEGGPVLHLRDGQRVEQESACQAAGGPKGDARRVEDSGSVLDYTVLDNKNSFYSGGILIRASMEWKLGLGITLTVGEGICQAVRYGEAGGASASDDEVIVVAKLGDLASNTSMWNGAR